MTTIRPLLSAMAAILCVSYGTLAAAQTPPPSQEDQTVPEAASSPHQREATRTEAQEAPATSETQPSSASSQHQREATGMTGKSKAEQEKMMKDCMKKEQQKNSTMSTHDLKKTCQAQMKSEGAG